MAGELAGLLGVGIFGFFFVGILLVSLIELIGKVYCTHHSLTRDDLTNEQIIIYLLIIWFVPLGWVIYLLLGQERTEDMFSDLDFL